MFHQRPFGLLAGPLAAIVLIGASMEARAQTLSEPSPPPLPSTLQADTPQDAAAPQPDSAAPAPQQASNRTTSNQTGGFPPLPLGHDGIREAQSQLIALGFDPGPADGEAGPATIAAGRQYNENRGGSGPVPIDGALLARLQQDTAPRLT